MTPTTIPCARCQHPTVPQRIHRKFPEVRAAARRLIARGLCSRCYQTPAAAHDFPRRTMSRDDLLDDWVVLRGEGYTVLHAADRLGISLDALSQALTRAKRAGDPRVGRVDWHGVYAARTGAAA